jgi:hypothetical protein
MLRLIPHSGVKPMLRKLRLIMCILVMHKKKLYTGGYRCEYCGKYVGGFVPPERRVCHKKPKNNYDGSGNT